MRRCLLTSTLVLLAFLAVAGTSLAQSNVVTVYGWSGDWDIWFQDWSERFESETGIRVQYVSGGGLEVFSRVVAEKERPQADIFISSASYLFQAGNLGALRHIPWDQVPNAEFVEDRFKFDQVAVFGFDIYQLAYNTEIVSSADAPRTWSDLADPVWDGRVIQRSPGSDLTAWLWMALAEDYGEDYAWEKLLGMFSNSKLWAATVGDLVQGLSLGEGDVSPASIGHIMLATQQAGAPIASAMPDRPILMLNGLALTEGSPNPDGAVQFLNFFLGEYVQSFIMNTAGTSVAVNKSVELTNRALVDVGLGGIEIADVLETAFLPDWGYWTEVVEGGQTRLGVLSAEIDSRVKGLD